MADFKTAQQKLLERIQEVADSTTDLEQLAYAASGLEKLASQSFEAPFTDPSIYSIGKVGEQGFGVAAIPDEDLPSGWVKLHGHDDPSSPNYGNVLDPTGSVMVWIPKFYYKIEGNVIFISDTAQSGYVLHRAFMDGYERKGVFVDKYGCGNVGGVFVSKQGIDPCSTNLAHNPIGNLNNAPTNNYGGLYAAVKTRGASYGVTSVFIYNALAFLAYAHGQAATTTANCAYIDVDPKMPKGNLNNPLADVNDTSVTFTASGFENCALTGSGVPFAKTTHNGQSCGVADLNGNMWELASGFILLQNQTGDTGVPESTDFLILKESVKISDIADDSATGGAYDPTLYDSLDLTGIVNGNDGWIKLGNGLEQVFGFSTDRTSQTYKWTSCGIPLSSGVSSTGTTQFGNDGLYRYLRNEMACIVGGLWGSTSYAGVFAMYLYAYRTSSGSAVGGRASYYV